MRSTEGIGWEVIKGEKSKRKQVSLMTRGFHLKAFTC